MKPRFRYLLHRLTEPQVLFPVSAVISLLLIWGATLFYVRMLQRDLEIHSIASTQQNLETYEAQVIRALGEIDQAMNLVTWWRAQAPGRRISEISERELLPPDLVFGISVADRAGRIIDSNRVAGIKDVGTRAYFDLLRGGDSVVVGSSSPIAASDAPTLHFARRLDAPDGEFDGAVIVEVEAAYFVSGYEENMLGSKGLLALIGDDGALRVERSGDAVNASPGISYAYKFLLADDGSARRLGPVPGAGGVARWVATRGLYEFPLSVVVGLSIEEQFAALGERVRGYYTLAAIASLICVIALGLIGKQSWQLMRSRRREVQIREAHAERVEYLAYHDGLTGLANRSLFSRLLSQSLAEARRYERVLAVLYLDLDRFKPINDTLGHAAGDQLLQEISRRLLASVRTSDSVARLGGDEFVVLVPELNNEEEVAAIARKILAAVAAPMTLMGREVQVTASIGIALSPRDGRDEETLKKNADAAMYQAKARGKNNFQFHTDRLGTTSVARLGMEANLRHALDRNELCIYYQARCDATTGHITAMEALPHWLHPQCGILPPTQFLEMADESGVIVPIGRWLLQTACEQSVAMRQQQGLADLCVSVNLTPAQFHDDRLLEDVRAALARSNLAPWLLELAIPETALTHRPDLTRKHLLELRTVGVRLAVAEFGRGYARLDTLHEFSFDTIKIDPSLTGGVEASAAHKLTDAVISVGRQLSATVVIPTRQEIGSRDRAERGAAVQGYFAGEPMPAEQFAHMLQQHFPKPDAVSIAPAGQSRAG